MKLFVNWCVYLECLIECNCLHQLIVFVCIYEITCRLLSVLGLFVRLYFFVSIDCNCMNLENYLLIGECTWNSCQNVSGVYVYKVHCFGYMKFRWVRKTGMGECNSLHHLIFLLIFMKLLLDQQFIFMFCWSVYLYICVWVVQHKIESIFSNKLSIFYFNFIFFLFTLFIFNIYIYSYINKTITNYT